MSKIALSGSPTGTGVFTIESPSSNTSRTLVLPDEAGTVLTSASPVVLPKGVPAFSAFMLVGSQSLSSATWTKLTIDYEEFDTNSNYDTSTYRFQPTVAGYYMVVGSIEWANSPQTAVAMLMFAKNGGLFARGSGVLFGGTAPVSTGSALIYCNGSSDYIEMYGYQNTGANLLVFGTNKFSTRFSGVLVRAA